MASGRAFTRKDLRADGATEANRALKMLPGLVKDAAQETFNVTAFHFARMAASAAPKDTGRLAEAIEWEARPRSLSAVVKIARRAFYWKFQEYGTVHHGAHPFLRPTKVKLEDDHKSTLKQNLSRANAKMEKAARG